MKKVSIRVVRPVLFAAAGAVAGLIYYHYFACTNGCPITSSPVITSAYMGVIGMLISQLFNKDGGD